ncbi:MAG: radical SAM protein [Chromatiales bacterium]|jgi:MoaA/NifB/PqqE/SkfB family radical SAM enzyme
MTQKVTRHTEFGRFNLFELEREGEASWQSCRPQEYWDYRNEWDNHPKQQHVGEYPVHIDVEMTARCNLKCPMCQRTTTEEDGLLQDGDMDWSLFTNIVDECAGKVRSIKLNFRGESLLHPQISEAIAYAKNNGFVEVMMNSNALLLTEDKAQKILDAGIDSIIFSFDFTDPEKYRASRSGASYEKCLRNIKRFCKMRREGGYSHVRVRINGLSDNKQTDDVKSFLELFGDDVDEINLFRKHLTTSDFPRPLDYYEDLFDAADYQCGSLWQRVGVLFNGSLMTCCNAYEEIKDIGKMPENTLKELWHSDHMNRLRAAHSTKQGYQEDMCRTCFKFLFRLNRYMERNNIKQVDFPPVVVAAVK